MAGQVTGRYIAGMSFSPFEPDHPAVKRRRFKLIPVRTLLPNLITLLALCAGLTAICLAVEDKLGMGGRGDRFAALLDGIDGRIARACSRAPRALAPSSTAWRTSSISE